MAMKIKRLLLIGISALFLVLAGCSNEPHLEGEGETSNTEEAVFKEKTLTLEIEKEIFFLGTKYRFIGFANEDTIVFEKAGSEVYRQIYHPADVGYTFSFGASPEWSFEIVEANRSEGVIKLKMTEKRGE